MTKELPDWLVDHITVTTGLAPGARYVQRHRCGRCRVIVLVGLDDEVCANTAVVDPVPITAVEERQERADGRKTYALKHRGRRLYLVRRNQWQVAGSPAGSAKPYGPLGYVVVADHQCRGEQP